jgi:hypothetical protein
MVSAIESILMSTCNRKINTAFGQRITEFGAVVIVNYNYSLLWGTTLIDLLTPLDPRDSYFPFSYPRTSEHFG